jgi:FKBP-type peptidyl-prolyl cis-trans isomerase FkpA/FKBP-type peptidyl-prolyl cis-trans isomerase FklB
MRNTLPALLVLIAMTGCASAEAPAEPALETDEQKTLYATGYALSQTLRGAQFDEAEIRLIQAGLADGLAGRPADVAMESIGPKINEMVAGRVQLAAESEKSAGQAYVEEMAGTEGAERTASGAIYIELEAGDGAQPGLTDTVKLHYHGTLRDGTVFDSSVDKGSPATFRVNGVIPCFSEGVQRMKVGGKAKLVCPSDTAYGDRGSPPKIKPGAALTFEVELLEIVAAQ